MNIKTFKYFYPEKPRLINIDQDLVKSFSDDPNWVAERKYNESRLLLYFIDGEFQFWNRHQERFDYRPDTGLSDALAGLSLSGYCLFDGGLRHNKVPGVSNKIVFYDVIIWKGDLLIGKPFWYRRNILKKITKCNHEPVGIPEHFQNNFPDVFSDVIGDPEIEGLVLKNLQGVLQVGRNAAYDSKWMYKIRRPSGRYQF